MRSAPKDVASKEAVGDAIAPKGAPGSSKRRRDWILHGAPAALLSRARPYREHSELLCAGLREPQRRVLWAKYGAIAGLDNRRRVLYEKAPRTRQEFVLVRGDADMPEAGLLVLIRVVPGREDCLCDLLNAIGNDVDGKRRRQQGLPPLADFVASTTLHFLRFALLDDPDRGPGRQRLLVATDFDGDRRHHIEELHRLVHDPDSLWGCCEGYDGAASFAEFVESSRIEAQACYVAFPGVTAADLRSRLGSRDRRDAWLAQRDFRTDFAAVPHEFELREAPAPSTMSGLIDGCRAALLTTMDVAVATVRFCPLQVLLAAREINLSLGRETWIRIFNLATFNFAPAFGPVASELFAQDDSPCEPAEAGDEVVRLRPGSITHPPPEDAVAQNQLTLVTVVKPESLPRLRAVLALIDIYARRLASPGDLIGMSTIHSVRWILLDDGKRLLMVSNYDGTWENYIDEFAEMVSSGLDAIWGQCFGVPRNGVRDLPAFKHFLRCHQVAANVFYSAYPTTSVLALRDLGEVAS